MFLIAHKTKEKEAQIARHFVVFHFCKLKKLSETDILIRGQDFGSNCTSYASYPTFYFTLIHFYNTQLNVCEILSRNLR